MKRKMKLTEKELAIGMWLYIKLMIKAHNEYGIFYIGDLKESYLLAHDCLDMWPNNCILCDTYATCEECPLRNCSPRKSGLYQKVCGVICDYGFTIKHEYSRNTRLKACDKIINSIEKDIPDDYSSVRTRRNRA